MTPAHDDAGTLLVQTTKLVNRHRSKLGAVAPRKAYEPIGVANTVVRRAYRKPSGERVHRSVANCRPYG